MKEELNTALSSGPTYEELNKGSKRRHNFHNLGTCTASINEIRDDSSSDSGNKRRGSVQDVIKQSSSRSLFTKAQNMLQNRNMPRRGTA